MLRVGLTGGLGSGKSTVGEMFRALGAHVIDADAVGRGLMQPGQQVYREIVGRFGQGVVQEDGQLDRAGLARLAFECGRIEELNSIVHPAVIAAQAAWMREIARREPDAVAIVESALIFETKYGETKYGETKYGETKYGSQAEIGGAGVDPPSRTSGGGWNKRFDRIILVTASEALRISRYIERAAKGRDVSPAEHADLEADALRRLGAQISDEQKIPLCDYVIENAGSIERTQTAVERIYRELQELSRKRAQAEMPAR